MMLHEAHRDLQQKKNAIPSRIFENLFKNGNSSLTAISGVSCQNDNVYYAGGLCCTKIQKRTVAFCQSVT